MTPNGYQLNISLIGNLIDTNFYQDTNYIYRQSEGIVFIEVPSGDIFESRFYGESHMEENYIWTYLFFDIEIPTPNGSRYYQGYLYTE
jgi:hypothetical protein